MMGFMHLIFFLFLFWVRANFDINRGFLAQVKEEAVGFCSDFKELDGDVSRYITQLTNEEKASLIDFVLYLIRNQKCTRISVVLESVLVNSFPGITPLNAPFYFNSFHKQILQRHDVRAFFSNKLMNEKYYLISKDQVVDVRLVFLFENVTLIHEDVLKELEQFKYPNCISDSARFALSHSYHAISFFFHSYLSRNETVGSIPWDMHTFIQKELKLFDRALYKNDRTLISDVEILQPLIVQDWKTVLIIEKDYVEKLALFWKSTRPLDQNILNYLQLYPIAIKFLLNNIKFRPKNAASFFIHNDLGPIMQFKVSRTHLQNILEDQGTGILLDGKIVNVLNHTEWKDVVFVDKNLIGSFLNEGNNAFSLTTYEIYFLVSCSEARKFLFDVFLQKAKKGIFMRLNRCFEFLTGRFSSCLNPYNGLDVVLLNYINTERSLSFMNSVHLDPKLYEISEIDRYYLQYSLQKAQMDLPRHYFYLSNCQNDFIYDHDANCTWTNLTSTFFVQFKELFNIVETPNYFDQIDIFTSFKILRKASRNTSIPLSSQFQNASLTKSSHFVLSLLQKFNVTQCTVDLLAEMDWILCLEKRLAFQVKIRGQNPKDKVCTVLNYSFVCWEKLSFLYTQVIPGEQHINFTKIIST